MLVYANPKANPPVCKIVDNGRQKYEEKKKAAEARKRQSQIALKLVDDRIDNDGLSRLGICQQIGERPGFSIEQLLENHKKLLCVFM